MDLIESLQRKDEEESAECLSEEGGDVVEEQVHDTDLEDNGDVGAGRTSKGHVGDPTEEKVRDVVSGIKEKKVESVDGDSEIYVANSEEEIEKEGEAPAGMEAVSRLKRKRLVPRGPWSSRTRAGSKGARSKDEWSSRTRAGSKAVRSKDEQ